MSKNMNEAIRVGVVEIGSRAIRLLVADVSASGQMDIVRTEAKEVRLAEALVSGDGSLRDRLVGVRATIEELLRFAAIHHPDRVAVFATEVARRLDESLVATLADGLDMFFVLDRKTEAWCSFLAAITSLSRGPLTAGEYLVVDQGSGSMEFALGQVTPFGLTLVSHQGHRMGTQPLLQQFSVSGRDPGKFERQLRQKVAKYKLITVNPHTKTIVLGSAATKLAWLRVRTNVMSRYSPKLVEGVGLNLRSIDEYTRQMNADPIQLQRWVDPFDPRSAEHEIVLVGLLAIKLFLERLSIAEFAVSARSSRYGFAWVLAFGNTRKQELKVPLDTQSRISRQS